MAEREVKVIGNLGDKHPLDYGGLIVFEVRTGKAFGYSVEAEYWPEPDGGKYKVSRFVVARFVQKDLSWVKDWGKVARFVGETEPKIREMSRSNDPIERANVYQMVGDYFGWANIDGYPITLSRKEMKERWPEFK